MAALKEIVARTGLSETEARSYLNMAEERVRLYLNYEEDEDLSRFSSVLADYATTLYEKRTAVQTAQQAWLVNAGMESKTYTEGPVSVHETYASAAGSAGASVAAAYDEALKTTLQSIARYRRGRVIKC